MADKDSLWPGSGNPEVFQIGIRQMRGTKVSDPGTIWGRVQRVFTEFCGGNATPRTNRFKMASTVWLYDPVAPSDIKPHEVVVYLLNEQKDSLIAKHFGAALKAAGMKIEGNQYSNTLVGMPKLLSEVYCNHPTLNGDPDLIGIAIIHELMHNKLNMNNDMHDKASGVSPTAGYIQENPARFPNIQTSGIDISTMAPVLGRESVQFLA